MPKLTDTQLVILSAAAQRDTGAILPPPKRLKLNAGAFKSVLKSLLRKGLADECPAPPDAPAWRETDDGQRFALNVSSAGFEALGIEPAPRNAAPAASTAPDRKSRCRKPAKAKKSAGSLKQPGSKQEIIIGLLRRTKGATVPDLQKATGWQPHSVRAALTGLRKKGHEILRTKIDGGATQYRINRSQK